MVFRTFERVCVCPFDVVRSTGDFCRGLVARENVDTAPYLWFFAHLFVFLFSAFWTLLCYYFLVFLLKKTVQLFACLDLRFIRADPNILR